MEARTQTDRIYQQLLDAIIQGQIAPLSRLRESDLAHDLGISRGPLREALARLESRKLVRKVPHVGAQVVGFERAELIELYQIRENLEALACELAVDRMSDADLDELGAVLERHARYLDDQDGQFYIQQDGDLDFHFKIIQASGNRWLISLLCDELYQRVRMFRYQSAHHRRRPRQALEEHQRIYEALRQRDGELAALLMKRHIRSARAVLEQLTEEAPQ
ncbi:GntR family transcriptional regulator [Saccharospirillum mangrovi]|uniref:GntR family transcriptional regulator n=1 Tax=Saccharospirillum mangrovi TaxID=2161747 RepID=UPI000D3A6C44|nr:GntR family transcriptional regulator [Saccharospirillum mangrovi]